MDFASLVLARIKELGLNNVNQAEDSFGFSRGYIRGVVREDKKRAVPSIEKAQEICDRLGIEFYIGPPRGPSLVYELAGDQYSLIPHYSLRADDHELDLASEPDEHFAFPNEWLFRGRLEPEQCFMITAPSDNMSPGVWSGDLVMFDRKATRIRNGRAYLYHSREDGLRLNRLELVAGHVIIARSDSSDQKQFPPAYFTGQEMEFVQANILGEVIWSSHTWR